MITGFLAIHQGALAECEDCQEQAALVSLCRKADRLGSIHGFDCHAHRAD